jgi:hypothetical protein
MPAKEVTSPPSISSREQTYGGSSAATCNRGRGISRKRMPPPPSTTASTASSSVRGGKRRKINIGGQRSKVDRGMDKSTEKVTGSSRLSVRDLLMVPVVKLMDLRATARRVRKDPIFDTKIQEANGSVILSGSILNGDNDQNSFVIFSLGLQRNVVYDQNYRLVISPKNQNEKDLFPLVRKLRFEPENGHLVVINTPSEWCYASSGKNGEMVSQFFIESEHILDTSKTEDIYCRLDITQVLNPHFLFNVGREIPQYGTNADVSITSDEIGIWDSEKYEMIVYLPNKMVDILKFPPSKTMAGLYVLCRMTSFRCGELISEILRNNILLDEHDLVFIPSSNEEQRRPVNSDNAGTIELTVFHPLSISDDTVFSIPFELKCAIDIPEMVMLLTFSILDVNTKVNIPLSIT